MTWWICLCVLAVGLSGYTAGVRFVRKELVSAWLSLFLAAANAFNAIHWILTRTDPR